MELPQFIFKVIKVVRHGQFIKIANDVLKKTITNFIIGTFYLSGEFSYFFLHTRKNRSHQHPTRMNRHNGLPD